MGSVGATSVDFSKYRVKSVSELNPVWGGSDSTEKRAQMEEIIKRAQEDGYEFILRPYTTKGRSGQIYNWEERNITVKVKSHKISGNSNLSKHLQDTLSKYQDVIVLQVSPTTSVFSKGRRGFTELGNEAVYTVMAKKKKRS